MKRDNQPWRALQPAAVNWSTDGEPRSIPFGDVYFSRDSGIGESAHVFLDGTGLPGRWRDHPRPHFCIGETGFGTGLNFLLTWQAWRNAPEPRPALHYLSIEQYPLSRADLTRALALWPELDELARQVLEAYPGPLPGQHRILLDEGRVRLDLWWEEATAALEDLASRNEPLVDAWYLDGFAPDRNEQMWSPQVLGAVAALSNPGATLGTFTVAGAVRRTLADAGFEVEKVKGYGLKRECLRARLADDAATPPANKSGPYHLHWDLPAQTASLPASALVIGAGLAGCATAAALARRGIAVTVLEQGVLAGAGSAMDQGIIYTRLSRKHSALLDISLQGFLFATTFYRDLFASGKLKAGQDGELCGSFQQSSNERDMTVLQDALAGLEDIAQVLDASQASEHLGIDQPHPGYWYPRSGWLHPAAVCRALLDHPGITLLENCGTLNLEYESGQWLAVSKDASQDTSRGNSENKVITSAPCAVVAAGIGCTSLSPFDWLPVQTVRGQVTRLPSAGALTGLRAALCHEGYIAPARNGIHCMGATFQPGGTDPAERVSDHRDNLDQLAANLPVCGDSLAAVDPGSLEGRVGFRCASPDYLPAVGPAPDLPQLLQDFGALRRNARHPVASLGSYLPGLYLNTAHGSRGLTSTPLAAELLASLICGEPPPLSRTLCRALAPARFIIRDLTRNRI